MHNKTRKNCIKLIKTIEKCKKVVYYEAINKEETGRGTMNNEGGGIVDRRDHDRCRELYVKYRQFMYWYVKKHFRICQKKTFVISYRRCGHHY